MAAVGAEVTGSWFLSSGLVGLFILLLLLIFLTALCSDCKRHSFELQDSKPKKHPSALIRVVKLEEVKENPMIGDIQKDEKEFHPGGDPVVSCSSSESRQGELEPAPVPSEGTSVPVPPWRSHLMAPQSRDLNGSAPQASDHTCLTAGAEPGGGGSGEALSPPANQLSTQLHYIARSDDKNSVYARVSKKLRMTSSPVPTPEEAEPQLEDEGGSVSK
ncbi:uncharacterized protein V3H82_024101 [Fundulus diaphanus]